MKNAFFESNLTCGLARSAVLGLIALVYPILSGAEVIQASNEDLESLIQENVLVIDVRTPLEWRATGMIPNSVPLMFFDRTGNYDVDSWLDELSEIAGKGDRIALICHVGNRSLVIGNYLSRQAGYQKVYNVTNGIDAWIRSGREVEQWNE